MLKQIRQNIIQTLWQRYYANSTQMQLICEALLARGIADIKLDHFAVIDLPSLNSGIPQLRNIFSSLGFTEKGADYLADKHNDFLWLAEEDSLEQIATNVLPQVVVADFRLKEMPAEIQRIIEKYAAYIQSDISNQIETLSQLALSGDQNAAVQIEEIVYDYFMGREWPLPTAKEFSTVQRFNELLAWVLIFGRRPNHFTLSIHLLEHFADLNDFHQFVEKEVKLPLNQIAGVIKGGKFQGLEQGSTTGVIETLHLPDGDIEIPTGFVEFVWRFPSKISAKPPILWEDYFTGFIAQHADKVIESLYTQELRSA